MSLNLGCVKVDTSKLNAVPRYEFLKEYVVTLGFERVKNIGLHEGMWFQGKNPDSIL